MGWRGLGAFVAWHDVEIGREAEYLHWHSHEHMQERLAVPGFMQGRRYSVLGPGPSFLVVYEVIDPSVFTSAAYLERLNSPSDWTRQVMATLRNMNRSLCRVAASNGSGIGRLMQTVRFFPNPNRESHLRKALEKEVASLAATRGLCAAHLVIADRDRSITPTSETGLRGGQDAVADWVLLIEGYDEGAITQDRSPLLRQEGADEEITSNLYALDHTVLGEAS